MKKILVILLLSCSILSAQDFVRGVYCAGNNNVDTAQMRTGLHLNWVEAVGENNGTYYPYILQNNSRLNVMAIMHTPFYWNSGGQHLEFEAELEPDASKNYFANRPSSIQDNDPTLQVSSGSAGYMVRDAVPDNQYRNWDYDQTYTASFIMKRGSEGSDNTLVARLEIWCKTRNELLASRDLYKRDFITINPETKTLQFTITGTSGAPPLNIPKKLMGVQDLSGTGDPLPSTNCKDEHGAYALDIRVKWYGLVTTWLDKVIIEDNQGMNLFSGSQDNTITTAANSYKTSYSLIKRFYFYDEPEGKYVPEL